MKIANLWLFFLGRNTGTTHDYAGRINAHSRISAVTSGPVAVEDSRGYFKRNALATPDGARVKTRLSRVTVVASSLAVVSGARASAHAGEVQSSAAAELIPSASRRYTRGARVEAFASASPMSAGARRRARLGAPVVSAVANAGAAQLFARARVTPAQVHIGPDEVAMELEEVMLLLEVV